MRFQPPLVITGEQIDFALGALEDSLAEVSGGREAEMRAAVVAL